MAENSCKTLVKGLQTLWMHTNLTNKNTHYLFQSGNQYLIRLYSRSYGNLGPNYTKPSNLRTWGPHCPSVQLQKNFPTYDCRLHSTETLTDKWKSAAMKLKQTFKQKSDTGNSNIGSASLRAQAPKGLFNKPLNVVKASFDRYREAVGLQVDAFWKRNYWVLAGAVGIGLCLVLWRLMFGIASTFVGLSEGMAKYGFLALATAMVAFGGLYARARYTINPDRVYRIAMRKLNTSAGILEVMGAPLSGTDVRAYVMSGGRIHLKNFKPSLRSKRCFIIFPIQGSERRGLVSVEVKKKKGQYDFKLLAVDVPMASGPDQRLFLIGDEEEYKVGGGLISQLRDPIVKAMAAEKEFEDQDQKEEEEDKQRELVEEENRRQLEIEKLEKERRDSL
ncbi:hypothetical protein KI387_026410 [Taxus chinensis]|uniref:Import inner membrane translocase subunit n=1 Tax=Taxus chinensis TaxID=29808 RepID=A0AA38L821_TAXCH|nr:hypothetical protein KI387_026410 [Taxus chinensis]